ncbi:putative RNA-binding protein 19 [Sciurus carolinensis]|uniref:RNA-binding protein 19 n=1 Tax=Sciurus carolinensis TaxID=30640 RepID=A0AA41NFG5_SCICA|nr:putative RNA-binding protein 19 [Sciurus carolinensis]
MKEERFRQLLSAFGILTDCSLKFTKDGKFHKFGFISFKSEEEAQTTLSHFKKSFIDSSWITDEKKRKVPSELEKNTESLIGKSKPTSDYLNFHSDSGQESEEAAEEEPAEKPAKEKEPTTPHTMKLQGALFSVTEVYSEDKARRRPLGLRAEGITDQKD